jgi:hypothetical protein
MPSEHEHLGPYMYLEIVTYRRGDDPIRSAPVIESTLDSSCKRDLLSD